MDICFDGLASEKRLNCRRGVSAYIFFSFSLVVSIPSHYINAYFLFLLFIFSRRAAKNRGRRFRSPGGFFRKAVVTNPRRGKSAWDPVSSRELDHYFDRVSEISHVPVDEISSRLLAQHENLQPQVAAIKEKYEDDPERMNSEINRIYEENEVNPLAGCGPLILTLPVFIGLYRAFKNAGIDGAFDEPWLFIPNLSVRQTRKISLGFGP